MGTENPRVVGSILSLATLKCRSSDGLLKKSLSSRKCQLGITVSEASKIYGSMRRCFRMPDIAVDIYQLQAEIQPIKHILCDALECTSSEPFGHEVG